MNQSENAAAEKLVETPATPENVNDPIVAEFPKEAGPVLVDNGNGFITGIGEWANHMQPQSPTEFRECLDAILKVQEAVNPARMENGVEVVTAMTFAQVAEEAVKIIRKMSAS